MLPHAFQCIFCPRKHTLAAKSLRRSQIRAVKGLRKFASLTLAALRRALFDARPALRWAKNFTFF